MSISSIALGGLNQAQASLEKTARRVAGTEQSDLVDLSSNAVALIQAKNDFTANTKVLKVADEMEKSAISLLA